MNLNDFYKQKYLKYKFKYFKIKTLLSQNKVLGGAKTIHLRNDKEILFFIKDIIIKNIKIRFSTKPNYSELLNLTESVDDIRKFIENNFEIILTKGYDRLYNLIMYITTDPTFISKSNNCKALIIAQFIIINQVFGDGNHRTAMYVLDNYSTYTELEINKIMEVTERIDYYRGDLIYLWEGAEANRYPNYEKLYDNPEISALLKN